MDIRRPPPDGGRFGTGLFPTKLGVFAAAFLTDFPGDKGAAPVAALTLPQKTRGEARQALARRLSPLPRRRVDNHPLELFLRRYAAGENPEVAVQVTFPWATAFEKGVYHALLRVPYGHVVSYKELAAFAGYPRAFRAVGRAVGRNPIPLLVPCHRVIRDDGGLGRYTGGVKWKKTLLRLESVNGQTPWWFPR